MWKVLSGFTIIIFFLFGVNWFYQNKSPLVLDVMAEACILAPDSSVIEILDPDRRYFRLDTKEELFIDGPPAGFDPNTLNLSYWLEAATTFHPRDIRSPKPDDGWLYDFHTQTATPLSELSSAEKQRILDQIHEYIRWHRSADISPNGAFEAHADYIVLHTPHLYIENRPRIAQYQSFLSNGRACYNPWKADSSGMYLIDSQGRGAIRFLPVPKEHRATDAVPDTSE